MTQVYSLGIDEIMRELNLGRATLKFILERFSHHLPFERQNGRPMYSPESLTLLIRIKSLMDDGRLPSQIDEDLAASPGEQDLLAHEMGDVRMSRDALGFIQDLFQDIKGHQSRIAAAHEKRAAAEERKAVAIEKRAEAEEKKALAMNNIAAALQEMSRHRGADTQTMEIAGQAAQAIAMNEIDTKDPEADTIVRPDDDLDSDLVDQDLLDQDLDHNLLEQDTEDTAVDLDSGFEDSDLEEIFNHPQPENGSLDADEIADPEEDAQEDVIDLMDLSMLLDEPESPSNDMDDLTSLIDTVSRPAPEPAEEIDDLEALLDNETELPELDDLSSLVEDPFQGNAGSGEDLDDLSLLVGDGTAPAPDTADLDDLSLLVEAPGSPARESGDDPSGDLDDLSALVDMGPVAETPSEAGELDDLSLLIDTLEPEQDLDDLSLLVDSDGGAAPGPVDDLWALVDKGASESGPEAAAPAQPMDDLSALVDADEPPAVTAEPSLKPEITPEQDLGKYKAAVMKIIISLKEEGLSAKETTDRLNRDEVPTLSGKPSWGEKAIAKIYGFIDSAK